MNIQLTWKDAGSQETIQQDFSLPLGIGRESRTIPDSYETQSLSKAVFNHSLVSGFHALIHLVNGEITFTDRSSNGTSINGGSFLNNFSQPLHNGDVLQIGVYKITVTLPIQGTGTEVMLTPPEDLNPQAANATELVTTAEIVPVNQPKIVEAELVESKASSITPVAVEATIAFNLETDNLETQIEAPQPPS